MRHQFPHMSPEDQIRTVSRYNGGRGLPGSRSDVGTTGGAGNDTIARAQYYAHHWADDPREIRFPVGKPAVRYVFRGRIRFITPLFNTKYDGYAAVAHVMA
ncbi:MAG: hypothetical protein U0787_24090 [Polyangia bacterium]